MNGEKRNDPSVGEQQRRPGGLSGLLYHNSFVFILSFLAALIAWFVMASSNSEGTRLIADVPINIQFSAAAEGEGLRVFDQAFTTADLEVSGSPLITNRLKGDDFYVSATLDPVSTKLTENTVQRATVPVNARKNSSISDYSIVSVNPQEVTLVYDRYREVILPLDPSEINYSVKSGFFADTAALSETTVTVSGPASSVGKVSRAAVQATLGDPLQEDTTFLGNVVLYDQDNQPIDLTKTASSLYLEVSVSHVEVTVPVLPTKTVNLLPGNLLHRPAAFPDNRVEVTPASITVAGAQDVLDTLDAIELDTPIDFAQLDVNNPTEYTVDIPLPLGVRNIGAAGENTVSQATVKINLNGYTQQKVTLSADQIGIVNVPAGMSAVAESEGLPVMVIGPQAVMTRFTAESAISVRVDLASYVGQTGLLRVPATVQLLPGVEDSCWVVGSYAVTLTMQAAPAESTLSGSAGGDGASPTE